MKKFIARPETMVRDSLRGLVAAHAELLRFGPGETFVRRRDRTPGKVALVSGGGAGHEPLHSGFVGFGMLDAACTGHIFTSPTPDQIVAAIADVDDGAGCLLIVKNYDGDVMNFEFAAEMAAGRHRLATVIVGDDVASSPSRATGRRGVAGTVIVQKILGAAAENGWSLDALKDLGDTLSARIRTMGVALHGATQPLTGEPTFCLGPGEMEVGVGIHGEPGQAREAFSDGPTIIARMVERVLADLVIPPESRLLLLVNGFGATPPAELYLAQHLAREEIAGRGLSIDRSLTGNFVTSLDTAGLSVTIAALDDALLALWDQPVRTPAFAW